MYPHRFIFPLLLVTPLCQAAEPLFRRLTPAESGVEFVNPIDNEHPSKRLYLGAFACGGVAIGDLDGDGTKDLFLTGGPGPNRLYRGLGELKFRDVTGNAGLAPEDGAPGKWAAGATLVDIEGDGDLDIHICNYDAPNEMWINDGEGRFTERAAALGLDISDASLMASFCDYDRDGDLDCFLLTRDFKRATGRPDTPPVHQVGGRWQLQPGFEKYYALENTSPGKWVYINAGRRDYLLENDGGQFRDVTEGSGISGRGRGNSCIWWDYDLDGWPDLYVGNDFKDPDKLYRNNRDGTFTDMAKSACPHTTWFSMGCDLGDLDGDGRLDLLVADMAGTSHYKSKTTMGEMGLSREFLQTAEPRQYMRNALLLNTGVGILADAAPMAGLANSDWTWSVVVEDLDGDGRDDVFFSNGVARNFNDSDDQRSEDDFIGKPEWDHYEKLPPRPEKNLAFRNAGGLRFDDLSGEWGLEHLGMSYAAAAADLDGDLDPDLVVASLDEPVAIYENRSTQNWVKVKLSGGGANRQGLGAELRIRSGGSEQLKTLRPDSGFLSCAPAELVFGLGDATRTEGPVEVTWPDGEVTLHPALSAGESHTISQDGGTKGADPTPQPAAPLFGPFADAALNDLEHVEPPYDDYARQPLLAYQHSRLGPPMAWGDVDGDGQSDLFLGGSTGHAARLFFHRGDGRVLMKAAKPFDAHAASEDSAALFFDADGDGDLDLFAASGSVECEPGDPRLRDRLYLNAGDGRFTDATHTALPDLRDSSSCVAAADYDRDGDLDLFVGSRVIPGRYPETPSSRLLRNDSEGADVKFTDVSDSVPALRDTGLVTAAVWLDVDADGWWDLALATEWGPVEIWKNREGTLVDHTEAAGLAEAKGWWTALAAADLDGDGDHDLLAGNFGLNTTYHASPKKPQLLYYGDVGETGRKNLIEAKFEGGICYPRRGFSCSSHAVPGLRERIGTFHNFATSSLAELYGEPQLLGALRFEANTLSSQVLLNDGNGNFGASNLPPAAQMAPVNAIEIKDFDGDGKLDAALAQNFYATQPETGQLDGGLGLMLKGRGDGTFLPLDPTESGIAVTGHASAVACPDLDGDGRPDLVFARNRGNVLSFRYLGRD